jgi:hypothetical protein
LVESAYLHKKEKDVFMEVVETLKSAGIIPVIAPLVFVIEDSIGFPAKKYSLQNVNAPIGSKIIIMILIRR